MTDGLTKRGKESRSTRLKMKNLEKFFTRIKLILFYSILPTTEEVRLFFYSRGHTGLDTATISGLSDQGTEHGVSVL